MSLTDRVAFVTGAGGGIGSAVSIALAKENCKVVLFGGKSVEKLEKTAQKIIELGGQVEIFSGDLTDDSCMKKLYQSAIKKVGKIDILINNAGMALNCAFEDTDASVFDKIMKINVRVPYLLTQLALPMLKKSDRASIINVASVVAHAGYAMQSAYVASKHALLGFTKSLAAEVFDKGIRVHAISPGGVYTDMVKVSRPDLTPDGMTMPEEVAEVIAFLLKHRNNAVIDEILIHRTGKTPFLV